MHFEFYPYSSIVGQLLMQFFVLAILVYLLYRYRRDMLSIFMIALCFPRVFAFFGPIANNAYKVLILLFCVYVFYITKAQKTYERRERWLLIAFVLFSLQYLWTALFYTQNTLTIIFSQYARYIEAILLYFMIKKAVFYEGKQDLLLRLFYEIGLAQIAISVFKFLVFRVQIESLVGSFSIIGGAMGTTIPILWFMVIWLYRKGQFRLWDWLYVLGLLFVGFTTGKRAVMFILPLLIVAFFIYVQRVKVHKYALYALFCAPLLFYFGVRLTPTLNPENRVWGSFDWDYALGYAEMYQFGSEGIQGQTAANQNDYTSTAYVALSKHDNTLEVEGRGGATIAICKLLFGIHPSTEQDWWGLGFNSMYSTDYATFDKLPLTIHVNHKGSSTGLFQSYVTTGLWGALCMVLLGFSFLFYCRNRRLRWTLIAICAWEYFMYTGIIFRTPAFMAVLFLMIHISNHDHIIETNIRHAQRLQYIRSRYLRSRPQSEGVQPPLPQPETPPQP